MSITLTDEFRETSYEGFRVCYETRDVAVFVIKEDFSIFDGFGDLTLEQYGDILIDNLSESDYTFTKPSISSDRLRFQYEATVDGDSFTYDVVAYKSSDAFWIFEFVTLTEKRDAFVSQIEEWASSVTFA